MEPIEEYGKLFKEAHQYQKVKNFYFESHDCPVAGETVKVDLSHVLIKEIIRGSHVKAIYFGFCPHCKTIFYNEEDASSFTIK